MKHRQHHPLVLFPVITVIAFIVFIAGIEAAVRYAVHVFASRQLVHAPVTENIIISTPIPSLTPSHTPTPTPVQKNIPIVMYHYVEYVEDEGDTIRKSLNIVPHLFDAQLAEIERLEYETYFVRDVPGLLRGDITTDKKPVVLTFDDGYLDFYTDAFPILQKYNMKATVYVVYNFIGGSGFMNAAQIQELQETGLVEVGSHAIDHYNMLGLWEDEARRQITKSKPLLEDLLGFPIETFAYPSGGFNGDIADMVKEASYSAAVSTRHGTVQMERDMFSLYRIRAGQLYVGGVEGALGY